MLPLRHALGRKLLAVAALLTVPAAAQQAPAAVHHGFPLAGGTLVVVVDGLPPGDDVLLKLLDAVTAPLSVIEELSASASPQFRGKLDDALADGGTIASVWAADARGRVLLEIPLDDPGDVDKPVQLQVLGFGGQEQATLLLHVQAPTLVLPTAQGLQRLSLLDGRLLAPAIPAQGGVHGLSLSDDGLLGYVLRDGGLLHTLAARDWAGEPLATQAFDAATDTLAGGPAGAAFLLARPEGAPFAAAGVVLFLDEGGFLLEPMGEAVDGRRVAVAADGLSAWVAEDDLIVREIDLLARAPRGLLAVGLPGDRAVADLLLDGRHLLVATHGLAGRGTLTALDLDSGRLATEPLSIDPLRLVALGEGRVLVVPASGSQVELMQDGLRVQSIYAPGAVLDAAAVDGGALLLVDGPNGRQLSRYTQRAGALLLQQRPAPAPAVTRLVSAPAGGHGVVVLLGDPSGVVHLWHANSGLVAPVPDLRVDPAAAFHLLP